MYNFFLITDLNSVILFCGILFIPSLNLKPTICKTSFYLLYIITLIIAGVINHALYYKYLRKQLFFIYIERTIEVLLLHLSSHDNVIIIIM